MAAQRPLAKALHTVTVVARVAHATRSADHCRDNAEAVAISTLALLGYTEAQVRAGCPLLFAACVKAVRA